MEEPEKENQRRKKRTKKKKLKIKVLKELQDTGLEALSRAINFL